MKSILVALFAIMATAAQAEETVCQVNGPHCQGCTEMISGEICDESVFSKCDLKVTDARKRIASLHLVTKDAAAKVDLAAIKTKVESLSDDYKLGKCQAPKGKKG